MPKWLKTTNALKFNVEDGVARITLNRPEKRNAVSAELLNELHFALLEADDLKSVHCVVLAGEGRDFCSGYDLSESETYSGGTDPQGARHGIDNKYRTSKSFDDDTWTLERRNDIKMIMFDMHKPVIARIHGNCVAGGAELAMLCDMLIASNDARIGFPPTRMQGSPASNLWLYHAGPQWAKRLLLTGDIIRGRDAAKIGLVLQAVPMDKLDATVNALAARLALIDTDLLSAQKRIVNLGMEIMGARTLQRLAAEMDARGHLAEARSSFADSILSNGLAKAFRLRDEPFGSGEVSLDEF
jgi:enoyl-CoA hydratase